MLRNRFSSWKVVVSFGVAGESWLAVARSGEMTGRAVRTKGRTQVARAGVAVRERSISDAFRAGVRQGGVQGGTGDPERAQRVERDAELGRERRGCRQRRALLLQRVTHQSN